MNKKRKLGKRIVSWLLCMVMVAGMLQSTAIPAYASHICPDCGDLIDDTFYCENCFKCRSCVDLCEYCDNICADCAADMFDIGGTLYCEDCYAAIVEEVSDAIVGECDNCGIFMIDANGSYDIEELGMLYSEDLFDYAYECGFHCVHCYVDNKCWGDCENCGLCYDMCEYCELCEECWIHCEECGACIEEVGEDEFDFDEMQCLNCAKDSGLYCPDCSRSFSEVKKCDNCETCVECAMERGLHCVICEVCSGDEDLCDNGHDPMCTDCAIDEGEHCPLCGACYSIYSKCSDGFDHCEDCCLFCESCRECFAENEDEICGTCGLCNSCEEEAGYLCAYCDGCVKALGECKTHSETCCIECCKKLSADFGCTHGVCSDSSQWAEHIDVYHISYDIENNTLNVEYCDIGNTGPIDASWIEYLNSVNTIEIKDSVKTLPVYGFYNHSGTLNTSIKKLVVSGNIKVIPESCFAFLGDLNEVVLAEGIEAISSNAFYRTASLKNIVLPSTIKKIDRYAFSTSTEVPGRTVIFTGDAPNLDVRAFNNNGSIICYYPEENATYADLINITYTNANVTWVPYEVKCDHEFTNYYFNNDATCTEDGTLTAKCDFCDATDTVIAPNSAKGHELGAPVKENEKAATCTEDGSYDEVYYCPNCGKEAFRRAMTIPARGSHDFSVKDITKATTTANGQIVTKCSVCGEVDSIKTIKAAKTIKLSATTYTYDGKAKKPTVTVKDSAGTTLKKDTDYTVTYATGRKAVGKYKVTIKGKGNYNFTKELSFKINPVKTSITSLTKGTKSFTVKWAKKTTQTTGYEIQYSTSSTFKAGTATKKVTVKSNKTTSKTIKNLKAKKKYYVRVRTYKTVSGTKYYSAWCTKKTVTTK